MADSTSSDAPRFALLFVPNLMGYARLACVLVMALTAFSHPVIAATAFAIAAWGDYFDGMVARKLGQTSAFGQLLDFVSDNFVANLVTYLVLSRLYTDGWLAVVAIAVLDASAHAAWTYLTLLRGAESHRGEKAQTNKILALYYRGPMLTLTVGFYQFALFTAYCAAQFPDLRNVWIALAVLCAPFAAFKVLVHATKLYQATYELRYEPPLRAA